MNKRKLSIITLLALVVLSCTIRCETSAVETIRSNDTCRLIGQVLPVVVGLATGDSYATIGTSIVSQLFFDGTKGLEDGTIALGSVALNEYINKKYPGSKKYHVGEVVDGSARAALEVYRGNPKKAQYIGAETVGSIVGKKTSAKIKPAIEEELALMYKNFAGHSLATYNNDKQLKKQYATKMLLEPAINRGLKIGISTLPHRIGMIHSPLVRTVLREVITQKAMEQIFEKNA